MGVTTRSYNQGFLQPGVFQRGVLTTMSLTTRGSYKQESYNWSFFTTRVPYNQGSYIRGFLQPGVLQQGLLTTMGLKTRVSDNHLGMKLSRTNLQVLHCAIE